MRPAATGGKREREGEVMSERGGRRAGEARAEEGVEAQREGREGWAGERARKKETPAGGRTLKSVPLDMSHSFSGWLKEVAPEKRDYAERERESREA